MADTMSGQLGSDSGREDHADGSGRVSGDLRVAQEQEAWRQIPEKTRIAAVKDYLRGRS